MILSLIYLTAHYYIDMSKKILISSCLVGKKCAYDGKDRYNDEVASLAALCKSVDICPEVSGGLGCPRERHEIWGGSGDDVLSGKAKVLSQTGKDHTREFVNGAKNVLEIARNNDIQIALLKAKSPSCANGMIHSGCFNGTLREGSGVAAALLKSNNIKLYNENEITTLKIHLQML